MVIFLEGMDTAILQKASSLETLVGFLSPSYVEDVEGRFRISKLQVEIVLWAFWEWTLDKVHVSSKRHQVGLVVLIVIETSILKNHLFPLEIFRASEICQTFLECFL